MAPVTSSLEDVLQGRPAGPALDKRALILDLCRGKDVLDLGCVQHSWRMSIENPDWLHGAIRDVSRSCTGVDFLAADVAELNARGYEMVAADVLKDEPPGQFDVVVAGDIVEHLADPGVFLKYVAGALRPDGQAVITTPNALYAGQFWTMLIRGRPEISPEHCVLFDPFTFGKLVDRSALQLREVRWLTPSWFALWNGSRATAHLVGRPLHFLTRALLRRRPYFNSDFAAILELRPPDAPQQSPESSAAAVMEYLGLGEVPD